MEDQKAPGAATPREDEVALLRGMLEITSLSGEEGPLAHYLQHEMEQRGLSSSIDGAGNAVGVAGVAEDAGPPTLVLLGHMDTAPGVVPVRQEGDLLYGRGAVDAKGPLAAFICAAARVARRTPLHVVVVGAVEEECPTSAGARFAATQYQPSACIIGEPSRWDRVTLGYKGQLSVEYTVRQDAAHTASGGATASERAAAYWNGVVALAAGLSGSSSATSLNEFERLSPTLRSIDGGSNGVVDRARLDLSLRLPPGCNIVRLKETLHDLAKGGAVVCSEGDPAYRAPKNSPLVRAFLASIRAGDGRPAFVVKTGTSDMNVVGPAWGCPILAYGPGDSSLDHTPHEHINLTEFGHAVSVLESVLSTLDLPPRTAAASS